MLIISHLVMHIACYSVVILSRDGMREGQNYHEVKGAGEQSIVRRDLSNIRSYASQKVKIA
jgi:hypothetical protein